MLYFKLQGIVWDLSIMRINYKLTIKATKSEKIEKSLKVFKRYNIINFISIRNKLTALGDPFHSILNYNLMGPVSFLRLPKELKKQKQQIQKKNERKVSKPLKNEIFCKFLIPSINFLNSNGILLFNNLTPINQLILTDTLKPRNI